MPGHHINWILGVDSLDQALKTLEPFKLDGVMQKMRCPFLLVHGAEASTATIIRNYVEAALMQPALRSIDRHGGQAGPILRRHRSHEPSHESGGTGWVHDGRDEHNQRREHGIENHSGKQQAMDRQTSMRLRQPIDEHQRDQAGKVVALGTTEAKRSSITPDIPATVIDVVGLPADPAAPRLDGTSLAPLFRGQPLDRLDAGCVAVQQQHQLLGAMALEQVELPGRDGGGAERHRVVAIYGKSP